MAQLVLPGTPKQPARVLIADDDAAVRKFLRFVLERAGHEVLEAADGVEAMKEVRREPVDLVLTDLIMPEKEGIETIRSIRNEKTPIRIIAMSGTPDYLRMAETLGADATLEKPINPAELAARVKELLDR